MLIMNDFIYFKDKADTRISLFSVLYITALLANLTVGYRYISIGSLAQSGGIFIFPISFIISDIITELYGSTLAKKLVFYGIVCQLIFSLYAYSIVHMPAPIFLSNKEVYFEVFSPYVKFAIASSVSIWIGSWVNIILLSKFSEYVGGKYFALRSFVASIFGELLVTVISMFIANGSRMEFNTLIYMIFCCFVVKTIISVIAIWPASLIVYTIEKQDEFDISPKNIKHPIKYIKSIALAAWYAKSYAYTLESINLATRKASLHYKGTRGIVVITMQKIVYHESMINKISPGDAAHIGFYYGLTENQYGNNKSFFSNIEEQKNQSLKKGGLNIFAICRDGKLNIKDNDSQIVFTKTPTDLYKNKLIINKFSSSQSLYIGYLSSLDKCKREKKSIDRYRHLVLIK